jgi:hypothetical protein
LRALPLAEEVSNPELRWKQPELRTVVGPIEFQLEVARHWRMIWYRDLLARGLVRDMRDVVIATFGKVDSASFPTNALQAWPN